MLAATILSLAAAVSAGELFNRQTQACSTGVHVIATGGANSTDPYSYGLLATLAGNITQAIPGSDMVSMPYNKTLVNSAAIAAGDITLVQYVNEYHAACPSGKIVLVGYSAGAIITMNGICQGLQPAIDQSLADSTIIATVVYGDQTRVAGQPYDLGTCNGNGNLTQVRKPALCDAFIPGIQSYCDNNDPQCCDGPPQDFAIHFVYPSEYDFVATDFVVSRYNSLAGGSISMSSTASSSSATASSSSATSLSSSSVSATTSSSSASATVLYSSSSSAPVTTATVTTKLSSTTSSPTTGETTSVTTPLTLSSGNAAPSNNLPTFFPAALMALAGLISLC